MTNETMDMTDDQKRAYARKTVADFTRRFWQDMTWRIGQMFPGADMHLPHIAYDDNELFQTTMEPQEWLEMVLFGLGLLPNADPGEIYEVCQSLAEWMFALPDMHTYEIPDVWYESDMGSLWAAAFVKVQGDELITQAEAAKLAGVDVKRIGERIDRGKLKSYLDPLAKSRQGKRLVRKSDILPK